MTPRTGNGPSETEAGNVVGNVLEPPCHYVVVRRDLSLGLIAAMCVHAAGESSPGNLPENTHAVVLAVPNEARLLVVRDRLRVAGVKHVEVREPDPPHLGALMALGLLPARKEDVRRYLSDLPLLK